MSQAVTLDPAPATTPDWDLAKVLFAQGVERKIIADQCHVTLAALHQRAHRGNWSKLRDGLIRTVSIELKQSKAVKPVAESVTEDGAVVRGRLSKGLVRATEGMDTLPAPKSLSARANHGRMVKEIADAAKVVFAWDQSSSTVFDFTLHESMQVGDRGNLVATDAQVIEIPQQSEADQRLLKPESTPEQPPQANK